MAKSCNKCGNKIGFLDARLRFSDKKFVCKNCIEKYGFSKGEDDTTLVSKAIDWASDHSYSDFENLINSNQSFGQMINKQEEAAAQSIAPTNYESPSNDSEIIKAAQKINNLKIPKEIRKQLIDAQVFDFWFNNKELKSLSDIIDYKNGEIIKYAASGIKKEDDSDRTVLILCTNRRVIFLNKNILWGGDSTDIPLNMINSVSLTTHLVLAEITITNGAKSTSLSSLSKLSAPILAKTIKDESLKFQKQLLHPSANEAPSQISAADEIRKYKELADEGIITEEEFSAKKKQLLNL